MPNNWSEQQTRKKFIDKLLLESGWKPIAPYVEGKQFSQGAVEEFPTQSGPADYMLFNQGKSLAAVEGKKVAVGPQNVLKQAERYSQGASNSPFRFGDFSLNYEAVYFVLSADYNVYMDKQQEINFALKDHFEKEGVEFAYPTQTLYLAK